MESGEDPIERAARALDKDDVFRGRRYSFRPCPGCGETALRRIKLAAYLRPLRLLGVKLASYRCEQCGRQLTLRRR